MWNSVQLSLACNADWNLLPSNWLDRSLSQWGVDRDARYEIGSAVRSVDYYSPLKHLDIVSLQRSGAMKEYEFRSEAVELTHPHLTARWHRWIWEDANGRQQRDATLLGASALLAVSCNVLATRASAVLANRQTRPTLFTNETQHGAEATG